MKPLNLITLIPLVRFHLLLYIPPLLHFPLPTYLLLLLFLSRPRLFFPLSPLVPLERQFVILMLSVSSSTKPTLLLSFMLVIASIPLPINERPWRCWHKPVAHLSLRLIISSNSSN